MVLWWLFATRPKKMRLSSSRHLARVALAVRIVIVVTIATVRQKVAKNAAQKAAIANISVLSVAMKRLLIIFVALLAIPFGAQAKGVTYFQGTIYEALQEASVTSRLLLVEFLAPWNYKSRWAHDNMLNNSTLSDNFVLYSIETTTVEGAELATTYEVFNYPNILIFNKSGNVIDRIDRTMSPEDFTTRLSQIMLSTDGHSTLQLRQIYMAASNGDLDELNSLAAKYLSTFEGSKQDVSTLMDLFTSTSINYYGSATFDYMNAHRASFDSVFIDTKINELLTEAVLAYISGIKDFNKEQLDQIVSLSRTYSCSDHISSLARLAAMRQANDAIGFIQLLDRMADKLPSKYLYPLVLSLDFVDAKQLDKSMCNSARRVIEKFTQTNISAAKNMVIESLIEKFH